MSNLGMYQTMVTLAKRVGGPWPFMGLLVGGGIAAGIAIDRAAALASGASTWKSSNQARSKIEHIFVVGSAAVSNDGLTFEVGDRFKVLESDGDAVLIEKIGDTDNPHVVSGELLESISAYKHTYDH